MGLSQTTTWQELQDMDRSQQRVFLDQGMLAALALRETIQQLADRPSTGIRIQVKSELPPGSGFGSSAALSLALPAAALEILGSQADRERLERISMRIEGHQHGSPSGIDTAAALNGGVLWAWKGQRGALTASPLSRVPIWVHKVRVYQSGRPRQSTGEVVAGVRRLREKQSHLVDSAFSHLESCALTLRDPFLDDDTAMEAIQAAHRALTALGVVPERVASIIDEIEAQGGAAKISGAGALDGAGAGSILVYHPDPERIESWRFLRPWQGIQVSLGAPGLRREDT
jgi:mevalonate kinase